MPLWIVSTPHVYPSGTRPTTPNAVAPAIPGSLSAPTPVFWQFWQFRHGRISPTKPPTPPIPCQPQFQPPPFNPPRSTSARAIPPFYQARLQPNNEINAARVTFYPLIQRKRQFRNEIGAASASIQTQYSTIGTHQSIPSFAATILIFWRRRIARNAEDGRSGFFRLTALGSPPSDRKSAGLRPAGLARCRPAAP